MAKQFMNRNRNNNRQVQPRFRNRQINKARSQSRQQGPPMRNRRGGNFGNFRNNRNQFNNRPINRAPAFRPNNNFGRKNRTGLNRPMSQGGRMIKRSNYRQQKRRANQPVSKEAQNIKNMKMEEGLDKQLDSYWGKAENQEVKNVYKFNCEKNMDDELDSYWNNKGQNAAQKQVAQENHQQQENDHDANPI